MREARCTVCGRDTNDAAATDYTTEFPISFGESTCRLCGVTLTRALAGFVELLRQSHGEKRERVLDRLVTRLADQGFDITRFPRRAG
jgi:hypothetical protein